MIEFVGIGVPWLHSLDIKIIALLEFELAELTIQICSLTISPFFHLFISRCALSRSFICFDCQLRIIFQFLFLD